MYEVPCLDLNGNIINKFYQWDIDQKIVIKLEGCDDKYLKIPPEVHFCNASRAEALIVRSLKSGRITDGGANIMTDPSNSESSIATLNPGDRIVYSEYIKNGGDIGTSYEEPSEWCSFEYKSAKRYIKTSDIERDNYIIVADVPNILLQEPYPLLVYVYLTDVDDSSSQRTILFSEIPIRKRAMPSDYLYVENISRITADIIKDEIEQSTKDARTNAINTVNSKRDEFIATGDSLITEATTIKNDTKTTYDNAVIVAKQTQTTIQTDMNNLMLKNGLTLKTINDGSGNVNVAIIINS